MTAIRALPSVPNLISLNMERINTPDSVASGFQTLLQNQVKLSQSHGSTAPDMQLKQPATLSPHRLDIDSMLAQLLASRKMLLQPMNSARISGKTNREAVAECTLADHADNETAEISHSAQSHKVGSSLCRQRIKDDVALRSALECNAVTSDYQQPCQPLFPAEVMANVTNIFIWAPPEIVRFPVYISRRRPLRIRRLRLLESSGYRPDSSNLNQDD